ncbi:MAG: rhodanese-like domain-containing protein [Chitinophagaceae bacterium]
MQEVSVIQLKSLMDEQPSLHLIDVREPDERAAFNIGGTFLPLGKIMSFELDTIESMKDEPVYVYCRSGKRSLQACMMLEQAGFTDVHNVTGGVLAWQSEIEK